MTAVQQDPTLSLWDGRTLWDGYRLVRLRGRGAFGQVWEAESSDGKRIALKFLRCREDLESPRELRNILTIRQLSHPNLLRIDQVRCDRGYLIIFMELADGSLADLLEVCQRDFGAPLPVDQVFYFLKQAAEALDFLNAHQHDGDGVKIGIQHCDIKPSNMVLVGATVKLCDFGLSSATTAQIKLHRRAGTPAYAAPEVFRGQLSDWTDQYALAVSYCELRGGRVPFARGPSRLRLEYTRPEPDLSMLSAAERPVIARALARTPRDRWPSCGEMMAHLAQAATIVA